MGPRHPPVPCRLMCSYAGGNPPSKKQGQGKLSQHGVAVCSLLSVGRHFTANNCDMYSLDISTRTLQLLAVLKCSSLHSSFHLLAPKFRGKRCNDTLLREGALVTLCPNGRNLPITFRGMSPAVSRSVNQAQH